MCRLYRLEVLNDLFGRRVLPVSDRRPRSIGRSPDSDVHLSDVTVARRHALVWQQGEEVWVRDQDSHCGTHVNRARTDGPIQLDLDDVIAAGRVNLRLVRLFPVDRLWLAREGGEILRLARQIEREKVYAELQILGDALEEAGCADAVILGHCRRGGEHLAGCCVVEQLLGVALSRGVV
jgi:hypothetical protein